ncbi:hypothetical protein TorRG33x02_139170, partial [Trema orientale]
MSKEATRNRRLRLVDLFPLSKLLKLKNEKIAQGDKNIEAGEKDLIDVLLQLHQSCTVEFPISNDNIKALIAC